MSEEDQIKQFTEIFLSQKRLLRSTVVVKQIFHGGFVGELIKGEGAYFCPHSKIIKRL